MQGLPKSCGGLATVGGAAEMTDCRELCRCHFRYPSNGG
ncbi:MAG: hypothetical protein JNM11_10770 [Chitinimonas sp.]|nr:hypothetical protein [Chitinimonas sp.]